MAESRNTLSFHGKGSTLFGMYLVNILLSVITLGIYSFWGKVKILKYQYEQTQLNGSPFLFSGTGGQMFVGFLKLLGIVLVFLYLPLGLLFWGLYSTILAGAEPGSTGIWFLILIYAVLLLFVGIVAPMAANGYYRYRLRTSSWRGMTGRYTGKNKELIPMFLGGMFLGIITLGIYFSWLQVKVQKYIFSKLSFGNLRVEFTGTGGELFWLSLKSTFLMIITLGIYTFWYLKNFYRWLAENTVIRQGEFSKSVETTVTAGAIFKFLFLNGLLFVVTLGLATPWILVNTQRFWFAHVVLPAVDLDNLQQGAEADQGTATGEEAHDVLDLGDFGLL